MTAPRPSPGRRVGADLVNAALGVKLALELAEPNRAREEADALRDALTRAEALLTPSEEEPT